MDSNQEETKVYQALDELGIDYKIYQHPPVNTVEEAAIYWKDIHALHCKNLFLRDPKGRQHFLLIVPFDRQVDIRKFWEQIGSGRLSFASPERLWKYLKIRPGSVSPFGLINDEDDHVIVYLDEDIRKAENTAFHPNVNTSTVVLSSNQLLDFLKYTGNIFKFVKLE